MERTSSTAEMEARVINRFAGDTGTWRPRPTMKLATKNDARVEGIEISKSSESLVGFISAHSPARSWHLKDRLFDRVLAKSLLYPLTSKAPARRAGGGFVDEELLGAWRI